MTAGSLTVDPLKDAARLREIAALGLDAPEVGEILDGLVEEAARRLDLPVGVISVVMDESQSFVAAHGLEGWIAEARGTPVEWSFCQHVVTREAEFVVEDAAHDPTMQDSPLVRNEGIRCYAGIPLVTSRGFVVGSFCVQGREERTFSAGELQVLRDLADQAMEHIESRRAAPDRDQDARWDDVESLEATTALHARRLRALHAIDRSILAADSMEDVAIGALTRLRSLIGCERAAIGVFDFPAGEIIAYAAEVDAGEIDNTGARIPLAALGDELQRLMRGSTFLAHDIASGGEIPPALEPFRERGIRSSAQIPMMAEGEPVGVLSLMATRPNAFRAPEMAIADEVAAQLAIALVHHRLRDEQARRTEELEQLVGELRASERERADLLRRLVHAHEDERRVIAAAVHDDAVQKMAAVVLRLDLIGMQHPELEADELTKVRASVHEAIERLRDLMFELHPAALDTGGLATALRLFVEERGERSDEPVYELEVRASREPAPEMRATLFRIAQEAARNARKHARASTVSITLDERDGGFDLVVADDGVGFDADSLAGSPPGHLGLTTMRERAEMVGGRCTVTSSRDAGTTVRVWVPASTDGEPAPA